MQTTTDTAAIFGNLDGVLAADARAALNLIPPPDLLPSTWAEGDPARGIKAAIHIAVGNAIPGPINFDNAPYQRGMLDVIKERGIFRADFMLAAQLGKTTVQQCQTGYFIEHEPRSQIFAQPTQGDLQTFLETKLRPMLEANPRISSKMAKPRGREGVNNSRIMSYLGGWLMFSWSGSPKTARGRSAPITSQDEIDGYEVTPEGDFSELLAQRSATFGDQRLDIRSSTPIDVATSRIYRGFLAGDQRRYYVACPDCGHPQYFRWEQVWWSGRKSTGVDDADADLKQDHQPETAAYCCEDCGSLWTDGQRIAAIRNAERLGHGWKAAKPFKGHASFHGPEMLSTFRRLREIVASYLTKLDGGDLQTFVNVSLGWPFEAGDRIDPDSLMGRREEYRAQVPMGGLWLSAGVDMQQDRLEVEAVAWGIGEESWSVDVIVIWGDPLNEETWQDLEDVLAGTYRHESGAVLPISAAVVDTGGTGGMSAAAYAWLERKTGRRIFGGKGIAGWGRPIAEKPVRKRTGKKAAKFADLVRVGVDEAKLVIQRNLAKLVPGPGYCHFPQDEAHDADYFAQLTAERLVVRYVKGQPVREWHKADRDRNEKLDCRVYAYAAMKLMHPSFRRLAERLGVTVEHDHENQTDASAPAVAQKPMKFRKREQKPQAPVTETKEIPQEAPPEPANDNAKLNKRPKLKRGRRGTWATTW